MTDSPSPQFTVIAGADVRREVEADRAACLDLVRRAYLTHDDDQTRLPHSSFLRFPDRPRDRIIALPAYLGGDFEVAGIKWIASFPGNVELKLPRASALLVLNDTATGFPYACLEASVISAARTAASAVLAAEALTGERRAQRIGFVGTGLIADQVRRFFHDLHWQVDGYRLFDTRRPQAEAFAEALLRSGAEDVEVVDSAEQAFTECDIVVVATIAAEPHLDDESILAHAPVVLHLSLRDLTPELILAGQNVTDDVDHVLREGTSLHLAEALAGHRDFVHGTLADVLRDRLQRDPKRATLFSPFGLGVLDLAVGHWVHERVAARAEGTAVTDFFGLSS